MQRMILRMTIGAIAVAAMLLFTAPALGLVQNDGDDVVHRRGGIESVRGEIGRIDSAGVHITLKGAAPGAKAQEQAIPWHTVRDVESEQYRDEWLKHQPIAEQLWRAVIRIERGDTTLAELQVESLFSQFRGQTHETALVAAEGLLRCRLARAANEAAIIPWLEAARMRAEGVTTSAFTNLEPVIDPDTLLCPQLPPVWPPGSRVQRLGDDLAKYDALDNEVAAAFASLYTLFVALAQGEGVAAPAANLPDHAGVQVLAEMLDVRTGETSNSRAAVDRTLRSADDWPAFTQPWLRYHLGTSLLEAGDRPTQDLGLVQLAHIPARNRASQPYLAGLALNMMAAQLDIRGEAEHAAVLRRLVADRYPGHPAAEAARQGRMQEIKLRP